MLKLYMLLQMRFSDFLELISTAWQKRTRCEDVKHTKKTHSVNKKCQQAFADWKIGTPSYWFARFNPSHAGSLDNLVQLLLRRELCQFINFYS